MYPHLMAAVNAFVTAYRVRCPALEGPRTTILLNDLSRQPLHDTLSEAERQRPPGMLRHIKQPTFAELYAPKLITVLREGYGFADFRADAISALTVAIVALPL